MQAFNLELTGDVVFEQLNDEFALGDNVFDQVVDGNEALG